MEWPRLGKPKSHEWKFHQGLNTSGRKMCIGLSNNREVHFCPFTNPSRLDSVFGFSSNWKAPSLHVETIGRPLFVDMVPNFISCQWECMVAIHRHADALEHLKVLQTFVLIKSSTVREAFVSRSVCSSNQWALRFGFANHHLISAYQLRGWGSICRYIYMSISIYIYTYIYIFIMFTFYIHTYIHTYIRVYIYMYAYIYIYVGKFQYRNAQAHFF